MKTLEELVITDLMEDIFTSYSVKKKRKEIVSFYLQKYNTDLFGIGEDSSSQITDSEIAQRIDAILKEDKASQNPYLTYSNTLYRKAKRKGTEINPVGLPDTIYTGRGGECLVMGELLFRGYNVNSMMVDEGIDLVASKDNVFYYIQVKTKNVTEQNRFYFQIKQERFDSFIGTQIRYILVARCLMNKETRVLFFTFSNDDIRRFLFNHTIPEPASGATTLSIKIDYDPRTGRAYIVDGKNSDDVTFNLNKFDL